MSPLFLYKLPFTCGSPLYREAVCPTAANVPSLSSSVLVSYFLSFVSLGKVDLLCAENLVLGCPVSTSMSFQLVCLYSLHLWPPLISLWSAIFSKVVSPPSFSVCEMSLIVSYTMERKRKRCPVYGKQPFVLVQVMGVNALGSPLGWIWLQLARCIHPIIVGRPSAVEHCWFLMRSENVQPYCLVTYWCSLKTKRNNTGFQSVRW